MRGSASSARRPSVRQAPRRAVPWCDHCGYTDCGLHRNELPRWSDPDRAYSDEFLRHVAEVYEAGRAEGNGLQAVIDMFGLGAVEAWLERARSRGFLTPRLR